MPNRQEVFTLPMMMMTYRFQTPPTEGDLRERLRVEIGRGMTNGIDFEFAIGYGGNKVAGDVTLLAMDIIALAYAKKVCGSLGGVHVGRGGTLIDDPLPDWASTPWTKHGLLRQLRIRFGRIRL